MTDNNRRDEYRSYRDAEYHGMTKDIRSSIWGWTLWAILFFAVVGAVGWAVHLMSVPGAIVSKTMTPDNILYNYEWFHDFNGQYKARVNQIKGQKDAMASIGETSVAEKIRLQQELGAIRQSCRDIVTRYNANATKTNRSIFMGKESPTSLDIATCES